MFGPFTKVLSIADNLHFNGSGKGKIISIELVPGGFSFLVANNRQGVPGLLESYQSTNSDYPNDLITQLPHILQQVPLLHENFDKIRVISFHPQYVLVPPSLFLYSAKKTYLSVCGAIPHGSELHTDRLPLLDAFGVYPVAESLSRILKQQFGDIQIKHTATVLIESALKWISTNPDGFQLFLHVKPTFFEMLLLDKGKLVYYNSFVYQTFADLMYYVFYVLEQHATDPGNLIAAIAGEVNSISEDYKYLSSYFRKLFVFHPPCLAEAYIPRWGDPGYRFFNLFNAALCEL